MNREQLNLRYTLMNDPVRGWSVFDTKKRHWAKCGFWSAEAAKEHLELLVKQDESHSGAEDK